MREEELRYKISENSFAFAKQHSAAAMSEKALDIYYKAISNKERS